MARKLLTSTLCLNEYLLVPPILQTVIHPFALFRKLRVDLLQIFSIPSQVPQDRKDQHLSDGLLLSSIKSFIGTNPSEEFLKGLCHFMRSLLAVKSEVPIGIALVGEEFYTADCPAPQVSFAG